VRRIIDDTEFSVAVADTDAGPDSRTIGSDNLRDGDHH
jgi:hypothetical protein